MTASSKGYALADTAQDAAGFPFARAHLADVQLSVSQDLICEFVFQPAAPRVL